MKVELLDELDFREVEADQECVLRVFTPCALGFSEARQGGEGLVLLIEFSGEAVHREWERFAVWFALDLAPGSYRVVPDDDVSLRSFKVFDAYTEPQPIVIEPATREDAEIFAAHSIFPGAPPSSGQIIWDPNNERLTGEFVLAIGEQGRELKRLDALMAQRGRTKRQQMVAPWLRIWGNARPRELRVRLRGSDHLALCARWTERGEERIAMDGLEAAKRVQIDSLLGGLRLLRALLREGRPRLEAAEGSDWRRVMGRAQSLRRQDPTMTWEKIAARVGITCQGTPRFPQLGGTHFPARCLPGVSVGWECR